MTPPDTSMQTPAGELPAAARVDHASPAGAYRLYRLSDVRAAHPRERSTERRAATRASSHCLIE